MRERQKARELPWNMITEQGWVICWDGTLLAVLSLDLPKNSSNPLLSHSRAQEANRWVMSLPTGVTLWFDMTRSIPEEPPYDDRSGKMGNPAAADFERHRSVIWNTNPPYVTESTLTIRMRPAVGEDGIMDESWDAFAKTVSGCVNGLSAAGITARKLDAKETVTYLHRCVAMDGSSVIPPLPGVSLSRYLGSTSIEKRTIPLKVGKNYVQVLSVQSYPELVTSALMDFTSGLSRNIRWVCRYGTLGKDDSLKEMEKVYMVHKGRQARFSSYITSAVTNTPIEEDDRKERSLTGEADQAQEEIIAGNHTMGFFTATIVVSAESEAALKADCALISDLVAKRQMPVRTESLNLYPAFLGSLPGNAGFNVRKDFLPSDALCDFLVLTSQFHGQKENAALREWTGVGTPNATVANIDGSPFYLNLNGEGDVGHTLVTGPTGSGKSFLLSFLAVSWLKYPGGRVWILDKDMSSLPLVRRTGGAFYHPGKDGTTFQPLCDAMGSKGRCMRFIEAVCSVQDVPLDASERKRLLDTLSLLPPGKETITVFRSLLRGSDHSSRIADAFDLYGGNGQYSSLFDSPEDGLAEAFGSGITMVEMNELMASGDGCVVPALAYLTSRIEEAAAERLPTLLILDEAWLFMRHKAFRGFVQSWLKTLRKFRVFVILATQETKDIDGEIASTIQQSVHTKLLLPDREAGTETLRKSYRSVGLTDDQIDVIADGSCMRPKRNLLLVQGEGEAVLDLGIDAWQKDFLTGGGE